MVLLLLFLGLNQGSHNEPSLVAIWIGPSDNKLEVLTVKKWLRKHHFQEMSTDTVILHQISLSLALLVATIGKYSVLKAVWIGGPFSRPINILIILEQITHYAVWCTKFFTALVFLATEVSLAKFVGDDKFCNYVNGFTNFGVMYQVLSGFVSALYRLIYLKCPHKVKKVNPWTMLMLILGSVLPFHFYASFEFGRSPNTKEPMKELCLGHGPDLMFIQREYNEYSKEKVEVVEVLEIIYILLSICTGLIYVVVFAEIYQHDEHMKALLGTKVVQTRHVKSAITLSYHIYKFIMHVTVLLVWMAAIALSDDSRARNYVVLAVDYEIVMTSVVEALSTAQSRAIFLSIWSFLLSRVNKPKQN